MFRVTSVKRATLTALSLGAIMLVASFLAGCGGPMESPAAVESTSSALNYAGAGNGTGNKALNLSGYEYVDSTHININLNHQSSTNGEIDVRMFSVTPFPSGGSNRVSSISYVSGAFSGIADVNLTKGTRVTLTLSSALSANTLYQVWIKGTLADDNGLTIGNYTQKAGFYFILRTPVSCSGTCSWSNTTPYVIFELAANPVPYENDVVAIFDRPISTGTLSTFLANLSANYKKAGTKVIQDPDNTTGHAAVAGGECYTPRSNSLGVTTNVNTVFSFPEFLNGSKDSLNRLFAVYNRTSTGANSYTVTLPSFTDISGHTFSSFLPSSSRSFTTTAVDVPGWLDNGRPTVTAGASAGQLNVSWPASTLDPLKVGATTGYSVYYATATSPTDYTNKWDAPASYLSLGCSTSGTPPPTSCTINSLNTALYYFVRVVPTNSLGLTGSAGYSRSNVDAVRPHL